MNKIENRKCHQTGTTTVLQKFIVRRDHFLPGCTVIGVGGSENTLWRSKPDSLALEKRLH